MFALRWRVVGVAFALAAVAVLASPLLTSTARAQAPDPGITSTVVADSAMTTAIVNLAGINGGAYFYNFNIRGRDPNSNNYNENYGRGGNPGGGSNPGGGGGGFSDSDLPPPNTPPNFRDSAAKMRSIPENSAEDVKVGGPIMAWDPQNDPIEFSLRGTDSEPFKIKKLTDYSAQLLVGPEAILDYEAQSVHMVAVVATDTGEKERVLVIEVRLIDVKLPGRADEFDVANNHDEHLDREEVEAAHEAFKLNLLSWSEMAFVMDYYYTTNFPAIDLDNLQGMVSKYDLNQDSVIDRSEVLSALDDFLSGAISRSELQEIVRVHFATTMVDTPVDGAPVPP